MNIDHDITIALTKGRILKETLPLLAAAGIEPAEDLEASRKLIVPTSLSRVSLVILRGSDVPTYVRHGAADLGIAGKDMLLESGSAGIYEPLDLGISRCRLMTAGPALTASGDNASRRVRVATKFVNVARAHYARKGMHADLIKLYGSMELAPLMGLADEIVDIVDTGKTLAENGMAPRELIAEVSSRLIVNKASMRTRHSSVQALIEALSQRREYQRILMPDTPIARLQYPSPDFDSRFAQLLVSPADADPALTQTVTGIVSRIVERGDEALLQLTNELDRRSVEDVRSLCVDPKALTEAVESVDPAVREALEKAIQRIRDFTRTSWRVAGSLRMTQDLFWVSVSCLSTG